MSKISGRINQQEREIAARVRRVRKDAWLSIPKFASKLDETPDRMASVEYARTPLTVGVADKIAEKFEVNIMWLATGDGPKDFYAGKLQEISPITQGRSLLSKSFSKESERVCLEKFLGRLSSMEKTGTALRSILDELSHAAKENAAQGLVQLEAFLSALSTDALSPEKLSSSPESSMPWRNYVESKKVVNTQKELTYMLTHEKIAAVNHWHRLKAKVQKAAETPGGRSMLAKFLGVDLTQISRWLSKTGPEPGADYTLKMLQWVQERESKQ